MAWRARQGVVQAPPKASHQQEALLSASAQAGSAVPVEQQVVVRMVRAAQAEQRVVVRMVRAAQAEQRVVVRMVRAAQAEQRVVE
jgi:hypothetical protein